MAHTDGCGCGFHAALHPILSNKRSSVAQFRARAVAKRVKESRIAEGFSFLFPPLSHFLEMPTFLVRLTLAKSLRLEDGEEKGGRKVIGVFFQ